MSSPLSPSPSPSVTVRRAGPGDEAALALVGQAAFLEAFAGILPGSDIQAHCQREHSAAKYAAYLADPVTQIWLAEAAVGAAPVGYLVLTKPDLPLAGLQPEDREVKRIYLLHRFQGQGLGARLMDEARRFAASAGIRRLHLGVYGQNHAAIAFYRRLGYVPSGERRFRVGANTYEDMILTLDVAPDASGS